jgi:hypothetical protein
MVEDSHNNRVRSPVTPFEEIEAVEAVEAVETVETLHSYDQDGARAIEYITTWYPSKLLCLGPLMSPPGRSSHVSLVYACTPRKP